LASCRGESILVGGLGPSEDSRRKLDGVIDWLINLLRTAPRLGGSPGWQHLRAYGTDRLGRLDKSLEQTGSRRSDLRHA